MRRQLERLLDARLSVARTAENLAVIMGGSTGSARLVEEELASLADRGLAQRMGSGEWASATPTDEDAKKSWLDAFTCQRCIVGKSGICFGQCESCFDREAEATPTTGETT